jgi:hypothetical protein
MSTAFNQVLVRGARRIRLFFTGALAAGAFTSTSYYAVADTENQTALPITVEAVFAISTDGTAVELSLSQDFTPGVLYAVTVTAVPTVDASNPSGTVDVTTGNPVQQTIDAEPEVDDFELLLYGEDLYFNGDYVEDATGDLATFGGRDNWQTAILRREMSNGVKWDQAYGAKSYQYVDAPQSLQIPFAGTLVAQAKADNRTKQATCVPSFAPNDPGGFVFLITLVGTDGLDAGSVTVPSPAPASP